MNKSTLLMACTAALLAACAMTPGQRQAQQAAETQAQHHLHLALLAQCDPVAADLASSLADVAAGAEAVTRAQAYRQKVSDPVFQRCYRLAWENHLNQARLHAAEREAQWRDDRARFFYPMYFGCRGYWGCHW